MVSIWYFWEYIRICNGKYLVFCGNISGYAMVCIFWEYIRICNGMYLVFCGNISVHAMVSIWHFVQIYQDITVHLAGCPCRRRPRLNM